MSQIETAMDNDAGGSDTIAATVEAAVSIGMAHVMELESDTHQQGSTVGDLLATPPPPDVDETVLGAIEA